ncbi:SETD4 [Scenedesmus sp. PABB004]|nr:SETD4 [Scenedesmus sp. PABB004]
MAALLGGAATNPCAPHARGRPGRPAPASAPATARPGRPLGARPAPARTAAAVAAAQQGAGGAAASAAPRRAAGAASAAAGGPRRRRRACPPPAALPVRLEDAGTAALTDWARRVGIEFPKLRPAMFDGVRGMEAASDIAPDEIIVSVPRAQALTLPPKQRCPCPEYVAPAYWDASPWFVKLGVRLLAEQRKGPGSAYAPWLAQLPRGADTPVHWSPQLLQQLCYPPLAHKVTEQQAEWGRLYEKFLAEGVADRAAAPSKQEFFRALSLVRSRTFSGPYVASTLPERLRLAALVAALVAANTLAGGDLSKGLGAAAAVFLFNVTYELLLSAKLRQYALCPVIDLLNHSSTNTTEVSYDYPRDAFLVAAGAGGAASGGQVFISYGAQTNDSLMQFYGFAEPDNPADVYVMTSLLKWLEQLQPLCQARLDRLNRDGLLSALQEVPVTRAGFGAPTLRALRYLLIPSAPGGDAPAGPPSSYDAPADAATEQRLGLALVHACQQELAALGGGGGGGGGAAAAGSRRKGGASEGSSGGGGSGVDVAAATAAAAAFRGEKRKVLLACLEQLTGGTGGTGAALAGGAAAAATSPGGAGAAPPAPAGAAR